MKSLVFLSFVFYSLIAFVLFDCAISQYKLVPEGADPLTRAAYYRTWLPLSQIDIKWYDGGTHAVVHWRQMLIYAAKT